MRNRDVGSMDRCCAGLGCPYCSLRKKASTASSTGALCRRCPAGYGYSSALPDFTVLSMFVATDASNSSIEGTLNIPSSTPLFAGSTVLEGSFRRGAAGQTGVLAAPNPVLYVVRTDYTGGSWGPAVGARLTSRGGQCAEYWNPAPKAGRLLHGVTGAQSLLPCVRRCASQRPPSPAATAAAVAGADEGLPRETCLPDIVGQVKGLPYSATYRFYVCKA